MPIGFRRVEIRGVDLLINGRRVFIRGVNRHDFDQHTGRVISRETMRADLIAMKRFGFNAVRTSHYPNDPAFLDLTDELGLYVIDEADIESHAFQGTLCDDPRYLAQWVDAGRRAWSCATGTMQRHRLVARQRVRATAPTTRRPPPGCGAFDPSRPLHYEGAIRWDWAARPGGHATSSARCTPRSAPSSSMPAPGASAGR